MGNEMATRKIIHTGTRLDLDRVPNEVTGGTLPIAPAARVGDVVYTSGLVGADPETGQLVEGGFAPQAERVLENLRIVLESAGSSLDKVAKVTVFLADIEADFAAFNAIYSRYFTADFPARTAVQARLAFDVLRVEVEAIAVV
jgi:2-iminobutanoate/2-iminopropanoate deaminase